MIRIIAIDPGGTIGVATTQENGQFYTATHDTPEGLWDTIAIIEWDIVLCERFAAQTISRYGLHTVTVVGGVQALCHTRGIPFHYRTPQQRHPWQAFAQKYLEERRDRTKERFVVHQADALAHLMAWLEWVPT